jgi:hypothetical protein
MNRLIKTLLIWLLMLAIPAQGIAAGMQLSCGPMHHGASMDKTHAAPHSHDQTSAGDDHQHHDHHDMAQQADDTAASSDVADAGSTHAGTCSACAACCVGAAMVSSTLNVLPHDGNVSTTVATLSASFTGFIPAGLERPPRVFLS